MKSPSMEPTAAAIPRGGALGRVRVAYGVRGPRRAVGAVLAGPGRRRVLVAALPEPLDPLLLAQEDAVALAPEADEVHGDVVSAEISSPPAAPGRTVRVKFVLKKQCVFGQRFHLVGDDPVLGLWDPSKAIALDWSEGHHWTVEKDLPASRLIEFKFLLQDSAGKFHWQDGPNRSLQTGETTNTLVVYEDWGDVKNQLIAEEGDASVGMVETFVPDDGNSRNDVVLADELQVDDNEEIKEDESSVGEDDEKSTVAANASVQGESVKAHEADQPEFTGAVEHHRFSGPIMRERIRTTNSVAHRLAKGATKQISYSTCIFSCNSCAHSCRACPVGAALRHLMMDEPNIQDELDDKVDAAPHNSSVTTSSDDDYAERTDDDNILSKDGVPVKNGWTGAFERELLWGWRALQQLLMSLGFKMDTT